MSYVFLLLTVSTALGVALLFAVDKGSRVLFRLWRWLIHRLGPGVFPSAWGMMNGVLPLALLSLAIGVWLGLAVTPGMAKLAPGPIEDVDRLASGFTLVGMIGCGLRGLHYMACRTLET
ncbi:hypothetical protein BIS06_02415, partial [Halomonas sp. BBD48]|nr:hypothetical protein [Halomonas sp. BBD48]